MTMYLEVYDSSTNEILARTVDRKQATDYGRMMWQNSATNKTEARRMLTEWAETLRAGLDTLRGEPDRLQHRRRQLLSDSTQLIVASTGISGSSVNAVEDVVRLLKRSARIAARNEFVPYPPGIVLTPQQFRDGAPVHFLPVVEVAPSRHAAGVDVADAVEIRLQACASDRLP